MAKFRPSKSKGTDDRKEAQRFIRVVAVITLILAVLVFLLVRKQF